MALTISEMWIRERVHLDPENLDDVRSLALPGTYHEKVTHLGTALQNFCRLKHLDLSRNALQSLEGLQHLTVLEKLNIYYNNISTLKDLYQLCRNACLQEVDLRLNPVTKNEPDYRLFMVHMLPNLRKLDDRSVRESERKAALMHFNSDQASELTEHLPAKRPTETDRVANPRAQMVADMQRKTTVLDEDDCDVLDLIARSGGDLGRPRDITGSKARASQADTHSPAEQLNRETADAAPPGIVDPPSTKYPPSPSPGPSQALDPAATQVDGARRARDENEAAIGNRNPEERMLGLEVSGGTDRTDNNACLPALDSPEPSPHGNIPSLTRKPALLSPALLTPHASPDIGLRPVLRLRHNISALKHTVIQSYLDDRVAGEAPCNSFHVEPRNRSPDELTSPSSFSTQTKVHSSSERNVSPRCPSPHSVASPAGDTRSESGSPQDKGEHRPSGVSDLTVGNRNLVVRNIARASHNASDMWEYGLPLAPFPVKAPRHKTRNVSWQATDCESSSAETASPETRPNILKATNSHSSHTNSKAPAGDGIPRGANAKSVSFLISPSARESRSLSVGADRLVPTSVPKSAPRKPNEIPIARPNILGPRHLCAIMNSPPDERKGSPTLPAGSHPQSKERVRVQFSDGENGQDSKLGSDPRYAEESRAYTAYTSRGHFTPHPEHTDQQRETEVRSSPRDHGHPVPPEGAPDAQPTAADDDRVDLGLFLDTFLSLVDRYWNGTKSLHRHGKFQSQAHTLLSTLTKGIVSSVSQRQTEIPKESAAETGRLRRALRASQDQVATLKDELDAALADKRNFQAKLDAVQREMASADKSADRSGDVSQATDRTGHSGVSEREIEKLRVENESLRLHVKHFNQLQELATMLQESHKSLVTTNDHLLQELDETKQRHLEEVKQLHWSYSELKRTVELVPGMQGTGRHAELGYAVANGTL